MEDHVDKEDDNTITDEVHDIPPENKIFEENIIPDDKFFLQDNTTPEDNITPEGNIASEEKEQMEENAVVTKNISHEGNIIQQESNIDKPVENEVMAISDNQLDIREEEIGERTIKDDSFGGQNKDSEAPVEGVKEVSTENTDIVLAAENDKMDENEKKTSHKMEIIDDSKLESENHKGGTFEHSQLVDDSILNKASKNDLEFGLKSCDSFFVIENPEGQDIINDLFTERHSRLRIENGSIFSNVENEMKTESVQLSEQTFHRLDIIDKLKAANNERKGMLFQNQYYQSRLLDYFRMVKVKQTAGTKQNSDKESLMDFNTQYTRYGEILSGLMKEFAEQETKFNDRIQKLKSISEIKAEQVSRRTKDFLKYEESIGVSALHSRTGNKLDPSVINDYLQSEMKKEVIIKEVRLNNLKIEHKNNSLDKSLRSKENFEGGLRLIDFEQLKIENQTFNEKVEDREEGINKLNRKITKCNHLLSHIKEKIYVTEKMKKLSRMKSKELDREFKKVQKANNKAKKFRDAIKTNNKNLQRSCGLLGKKDYLRCYEDASDQTNLLKNNVSKMEDEKHMLVKKNQQLIQAFNNITK